MKGSIENIKSKLKETGFKITPQRRAILEILLQNDDKHLSSEEIYDMVRISCPEIGLATVYRTMQLLNDVGLLSKLNLDDGCVRYEIRLNKDEKHNHHHLICEKCGKIIETKEDLLEGIETLIQKEYKFNVSDHDIKFYGICEDCQKI